MGVVLFPKMTSRFISCTLIGINRHFHMACIHDKFTTSTGKRNISSEQLWQHLKELYNLPALVRTLVIQRPETKKITRNFPVIRTTKTAYHSYRMMLKVFHFQMKKMNLICQMKYLNHQDRVDLIIMMMVSINNLLQKHYSLPQSFALIILNCI